MARKTVDISSLKDTVNYCLQTDQRDDQQDYRLGMLSLLEYALHEAKAYEGFRYLTMNEVSPACRPGINISVNDGQPLEDYDARFAGTDYTRRSYF